MFVFRNMCAYAGTNAFKQQYSYFKTIIDENHCMFFRTKTMTIANKAVKS